MIGFDSDLPQAGLKAFAAALEGVWQGDDLCAEIWLVSEEEIRALNARERGVDRVTDVLSFPSMEGIKGKPVLAKEHADCVDPSVGENTVFLGSVVICEKRARAQAEEYGHSFERELWYLAAHGVLHCLGYDHEMEEEKREMRAKEEEIMQKLQLEREV